MEKGLSMEENPGMEENLSMEERIQESCGGTEGKTEVPPFSAAQGAQCSAAGEGSQKQPAAEMSTADAGRAAEPFPPDPAAGEANALTLAYLGDAVFELEVRRRMFYSGSRKVEKLHKRVTGFVNAGAQSALFGLLEPVLTPEETAVYHRGRNSKTLTPAKHQSIGDYRRATGFEAVFGYLYLKGRAERIRELMDLCFSVSDDAAFFARRTGTEEANTEERG